MDYRKYMQRIEEEIGRIKAADQIDEKLWVESVMKALAELSRECALDLQKETGTTWDKGTYRLNLDQSPPARLLGLVIPLAAWLGWIMNEKHGDGDNLFSSRDCAARVAEAYQFGIDLSRAKERP
jgi:hypothetical protein